MQTDDLWSTDPAAAVARGDEKALDAFHRGVISGAECGFARQSLRRIYKDQVGADYIESVRSPR